LGGLGVWFPFQLVLVTERDLLNLTGHGYHGITTLAHPVTICDHGEAGEAEAFHCAVVFDLGAIPKKKLS